MLMLSYRKLSIILVTGSAFITFVYFRNDYERYNFWKILTNIRLVLSRLGYLLIITSR